MLKSLPLKVLIAMVCGGLILSLSMGIRQSLGLFMEPMSHGLGWNIGIFSFALAIQNLLWGLGQPFAGAIADKFGSGRTLAAGGVLYAVGLVMMANAGSPWMVHFSGGVIIGIGVAATGFPIVLGAVGRLVPPEKRPQALGLVAAGGSFGQFIFAPISQGLIGGVGWWAALIVLAAFAALAVPMAASLTGTAKDGGLAGEYEQTLTSAVREAMAHPGYLLLVAGFFVCGYHVAFIAVHLPNYLATCNISPMMSATALGLIGFFNMIGTWLAGHLGGRYRMKYLLSTIYFARAAVIALFLALPVTETTTLAFSAGMGLLWLGTVPLTSGIIAQVFGARYLATLFGIVLLSHQVGAFLGAWYGGWAFDNTGSYDMVWISAIGLGVFAGLVHLPIRDNPLSRAAA